MTFNHINIFIFPNIKSGEKELYFKSLVKLCPPPKQLQCICEPADVTLLPINSAAGAVPPSSDRFGNALCSHLAITALGF